MFGGGICGRVGKDSIVTVSDAKVAKAVDRLQMASRLSLDFYGKPLTVCYSGGKDSQVLVSLAKRAGIPFVAKHNLTTVDAPETVRTVRATFRKLEAEGYQAEIIHPGVTMWELIPIKKMPPTRLVRYCCDYLKERQTAKDEFIATGVRHAESRSRTARGTVDALAKHKGDRQTFGDEVFLANDNAENRREVERCMAKNAMCVNPLIDWTDVEVFGYYWDECKVHNPLYLQGFARVGCIGCPMAGTATQQREFARYPQFERGYKRAFAKMLDARRESGLPTKWETAEDVFHWWLADGYDKDQPQLFGDTF